MDFELSAIQARNCAAFKEAVRWVGDLVWDLNLSKELFQLVSGVFTRFEIVEVVVAKATQSIQKAPFNILE